MLRELMIYWNNNMVELEPHLIGVKLGGALPEYRVMLHPLVSQMPMVDREQGKGNAPK